MTKTVVRPVRKKPGKEFPVVGIGASAGGLEAISILLKNLPATTGMAFVYIQHLNAARESLLPEILARVTKMKVLEARNKMPVEPDHFYIVPPDKDILSIDGKLILSAREKTYYPIDKFLCALAEKHREGSIGIILSGSANDGTKGLKAIKTVGGITFAQDDSAKFSSMPKSAISEGAVDYVLSPKEIAKELVRISRTSYIHNPSKSPDDDQLVSEEIDDNNQDLLDVIGLMGKIKGIDFKHYKMNTIKRRILRRMILSKNNNFHEYTRGLKKNQGELDLLYNDFLINVTSFYREPSTYQFIQKTLLPKILKNKSKSETVRIWIAACSTGEEAYSFAMMILEILSEKKINIPVQIFATDLSEPNIAKARFGEYSEYDLSSLSSKQVQRFFTRTDGTYRISKSLREMCVFAPHNIFRDPPFSRMDFISCCNLFIYLDPVLQRKALSTFHNSLNADGVLMLGKSETVGSMHHLFSQLDSKYKIYAKKKDSTPRAFNENYKYPAVVNNKPAATSKKNSLNGGVDNLDHVIDSTLLTEYIPPTVIINQRMDILQFRGNTNLFLQHSPGKASLNILKLILPELSFELRNVVSSSIKTRKKSRKKGIEINRGSVSTLVNIEVSPLKIDWDEPLFMIVFTEETSNDLTVNSKTSKTVQESAKDRKIKKLEEELKSAKDEMRVFVEDNESAMEELQSANEEIVSSNEELQSINEELETSKEEIESTNEELITTNQELQMRNEQLAESYAYIEAVIATIHEPMVILDKAIRIKSANRSFYKKFKLKEEETEGRLLYELNNREWNIPQLRELLDDIIPKNNFLRNFEITHVFKELGEKTLLLNAERILQKNQRDQLILLAIEDISRQKEIIEAEKNLWFKNIADTTPVMIWVADIDKGKTFFNRTWLDFTGRTLQQEEGEGWKENLHKEDYKNAVDTYTKAFDNRKPYRIEYRLRRFDGEYRWVVENGKTRFNLNDEFIGYLGSCSDIHEQKLLKDELEKKVHQRTEDLHLSNQQLERSNNELQQFAYVASHDLQEPLRKIVTFSSRVQQRFNEKNIAEVEKYLEKIVDSSMRMSRLIDDLLNFSRSTKMQIQFERVDLNKIIRDVLEDFDLTSRQRNTRLTATPLPQIEAIPLQMQQLFHNLISNAFKFTEGNKETIIEIKGRELTASQVPKNIVSVKYDKFLEIIVRDNGIGFEEEFSEQIFVIFQRLHDKKTYAGTGIGLALCKKIVSNHGGSIIARSSKGKGASFQIILPFTQKNQHSN